MLSFCEHGVKLVVLWVWIRCLSLFLVVTMSSLILSDYCETGLNYIILVAVISFCETMSMHICCISLSVGTKWCENIHGYATTSTYATIFSTYVWKHTWIWVSLSEHHFILHLSQQHSAYSFHLHSIPRTKPITTPTHIYATTALFSTNTFPWHICCFSSSICCFTSHNCCLISNICFCCWSPVSNPCWSPVSLAWASASSFTLFVSNPCKYLT